MFLKYVSTVFWKCIAVCTHKYIAGGRGEPKPNTAPLSDYSFCKYISWSFSWSLNLSTWRSLQRLAHGINVDTCTELGFICNVIRVDTATLAWEGTEPAKKVSREPYRYTDAATLPFQQSLPPHYTPLFPSVALVCFFHSIGIGKVHAKGVMAIFCCL